MIHEEMSPSEMLSAFLDGELPEQETGALFYAVAQSPELQAEMRQHITLHHSIQSVPLVVPAHLKESVFLKSGMAKEAEQASIIAGGVWGSTLAMLLKSRAFAMLAAGLMASTATFAFMNKNVSTVYLPGKTVTVVTPAATAAEPTAIKIEKISEKMLAEAFKNGFKKGLATAISREEIVALDESENNERRPRHVAPPEEVREMVTIGPDEQKTTTVNTQHLNAPRAKGLFLGTIFSSPEAHYEPTKFSLAVRGNAAYSFTQLDAPAPGNPAFNNMSASLQYHTDANNTFGIEVGRENFFQKYNGVIEGRRYRIEQNYQAVWGGASYRYAFTKNNTLGGIRPYGRIMIGGTQVGPLLKSSAGIIYEYDRRVEFNAAVEGTALFYNFQNTVFSTKKLGVSYGVSLRL